MNGFAVLVTLAVVGVDYGWQPTQDGQLEYLIQIEPALLERMQAGYEIESVIHPDARGVRKFRIRVGTGPLPRQGHLRPGTEPTRLSTPSDAAPPISGGLGSPPGAVSHPHAHPGRSSPSETNGPSGLAAGGTGVLSLPPPPALIGPDGKASVLVRPGEASPPASNAAPGGGTWSAPPAGNRGGTLAPLDTPQQPGAGHSHPSPGGARAIPNLPQPPMTELPTDSSSGAPFSLGTSPVPGTINGLPGPPTGETRPARPIPSPPPGNGFPVPIRDDRHPDNAQARRARGSVALVDRMAANSSDEASRKPTIDPKTAEKLKAMEAPKPWLPLVLTSLALFASLAANMYLSWIAVSVFRRYRDMVDQLHQARASLTPTA